jgi:hypothetical protein
VELKTRDIATMATSTTCCLKAAPCDEKATGTTNRIPRGCHERLLLALISGVDDAYSARV